MLTLLIATFALIGFAPVFAPFPLMLGFVVLKVETQVLSRVPDWLQATIVVPVPFALLCAAPIVVGSAAIDVVAIGLAPFAAYSAAGAFYTESKEHDSELGALWGLLAAACTITYAIVLFGIVS